MTSRIELTELERKKLFEAGGQSIPRTNGWRPIDTAPRDGTPFLGLQTFKSGDLTAIAIVKSSDKLPDKIWQCCASVTVYGSGKKDGEETDRGITFLSHWMDLPKPPTGE